MKREALFLGVDLGSSGVRVAIVNQEKALIYFDDLSYKNKLEDPEDWTECCTSLFLKIPIKIKANIFACSVDGTSGTLLACNRQGKSLGQAIPFNDNCKEYEIKVSQLIPEINNAIYQFSSISRALKLLDEYGNNIKIRHQADWISGWLINDWKYGEGGNNLRLGWDLIKKGWPKTFNNQPWFASLPEIIESGTIVNKIAEQQANKFGFPKDTLVVAGTTDSNAAVIASGANKDEGISILGSTIVVKSYVKQPLKGIGITNHKISGDWIAGGASNAGGKVLKKFFSNQEITELSRQINPKIKTDFNLIPLTEVGERFPINDPELKPVLKPRPVSDALFLHAILEGLARIEAQGWRQLIKLGAPTPKRIITLGGGAKNPQWKKIREKEVNIPIYTSIKPPALGSAIIAMQSIVKN